MAKTPRPLVIAGGFAAYFLIVGIAAWQFAVGLDAVWFPPEITRWIYTTNMAVAAVFLVGMGGLALSLRTAFSRQIRDLDSRLGAMVRESPMESMPPPLPDTMNMKDTVDRDIDELLESLSEVEASASREAQAMESGGGPMERGTYYGPDDAGLGGRRERLVWRRKLLGRYLIGPALAASLILGISGMMLPGADGFAQAWFGRFNTAMILGISYSWVGLGWYVAATIYALVGGRDEPRRR